MAPGFSRPNRDDRKVALAFTDGVFAVRRLHHANLGRGQAFAFVMLRDGKYPIAESGGHTNPILGSNRPLARNVRTLHLCHMKSASVQQVPQKCASKKLE